MSLSIKWEREGDGWVGRWKTDDSYGAMGQLVVAPTGGLHGGWVWSIEGIAEGKTVHRSAKAARDEATAVALAVWEET